MSPILVVVLCMAAAALGWWSRTQTLVNDVTVERDHDHWNIKFRDRILAVRYRKAAAQEARDKLVATIRGRTFGS